METAIISSGEVGSRQGLAAFLVTFGMAVVVGSALAFEHIGGYVPCALCLEQRTPYYLGIPFLLVGIISAVLNGPAYVVRSALMIGFLCLLATACLGIYHAGVEWGFWAGPSSCTASLTGGASDAGSLLNDLSQSKPPSCDKAAGRFLGISFAGWNVLAAVFFAAIALYGSLKPANSKP